jgi:hypothetical protein
VGERIWELHNERLCDVLPSADIIKKIESQKLTWVWHVELLRKPREVYAVSLRKPGKNRRR